MWQVQKLPLVPDRAAELPSVSPGVCGKPHLHSYSAASRVVGPPNWGALQVTLPSFLFKVRFPAKSEPCWCGH